jgi:hypothetical protein
MDNNRAPVIFGMPDIDSFVAAVTTSGHEDS